MRINFPFLLPKEKFLIYKQNSIKESWKIFGLAILFASITVLIDWIVGPAGFSANINVPLPQALIFYPAAGLLAEIFFHILPLAILLALFSFLFKKIGYEKLILVCLPIVALVEVGFQLNFMSHFPLWAIVTFAINLFLFELSQLLIFKKYDFASMYSFRLVYYLIWHIVWGYLRLKILF